MMGTVLLDVTVPTDTLCQEVGTWGARIGAPLFFRYREGGDFVSRRDRPSLFGFCLCAPPAQGRSLFGFWLLFPERSGGFFYFLFVLN